MPARSYRNRSETPAIEQAQIAARVPIELRDRLNAEADRRAVSVNLLMERMLVDALPRWEKEKLSPK